MMGLGTRCLARREGTAFNKHNGIFTGLGSSIRSRVRALIRNALFYVFHWWMKHWRITRVGDDLICWTYTKEKGNEFIKRRAIPLMNALVCVEQVTTIGRTYCHAFQNCSSNLYVECGCTILTRRDSKESCFGVWFPSNYTSNDYLFVMVTPWSSWFATSVMRSLFKWKLFQFHKRLLLHVDSQ